MSLPLLGKIVNYDPKEDLIIIKASFLDDEQRKLLERAYESKQLLKIVIKFRIRVLKTYEQLTRFFAMMKAIILGVGEEPTSQNVENVRKNYVVSKYVEHVGNENLDILEKVNNASSTPESFDVHRSIPRSLATFSKEELHELMERIEQDYPEIFCNEELWNYED
jgi:hypothetical protein